MLKPLTTMILDINGARPAIMAIPIEIMSSPGKRIQ